MWWNGHMDGWAWLAMIVSMVAFWGLLLWLVITLVRSTDRGGQPQSAEDLLAERFARGEIDEDEYHQRRDILRGGGARTRR